MEYGNMIAQAAAIGARCAQDIWARNDLNAWIECAHQKHAELQQAIELIDERDRRIAQLEAELARKDREAQENSGRFDMAWANVLHRDGLINALESRLQEAEEKNRALAQQVDSIKRTLARQAHVTLMLVRRFKVLKEELASAFGRYGKPDNRTLFRLASAESLNLGDADAVRGQMNVAGMGYEPSDDEMAYPFGAISAIRDAYRVLAIRRTTVELRYHYLASEVAKEPRIVSVGHDPDAREDWIDALIDKYFLAGQIAPPSLKLHPYPQPTPVPDEPVSPA